jgi:hypothetical protein
VLCVSAYKTPALMAFLRCCDAFAATAQGNTSEGLPKISVSLATETVE